MVTMVVMIMTYLAMRDMSMVSPCISVPISMAIPDYYNEILQL